MARSYRVEFPNAIYHIMSRGNSKQEIFLDEGDMRTFLRILGKYVEKYSWLCHAYCLIRNHYHLIIETPHVNLSKGMRDINRVYTQYFNRKHGRTGHVFEGRYKSNIVEDDIYFLELVRYLACNPVRAKLAVDPASWKWSSYAATCGEERPEPFLTTDRILKMFSRESERAGIQYRAFVLEGLIQEDRFCMPKGTSLAISQDLTEPMRRPRLSQIIDGQMEREVREEQIYAANSVHSYSFKEIADHLGIHPTTVSRTVKKVHLHACNNAQTAESLEPKKRFMKSR